MRLGVLGGTFDPIHLGHLAVAQGARDCASLDQVLLVPAAIPPHKGAPAASAADRLEMCRLAASDLKWAHVSDVELRRGGPSYTVDTLEEVKRLSPGDELFLILGWDAARELPTWRDPERVLALAKLILLNRPTLPKPSHADLERAGIDPTQVVLCPVATPDIRATDVRRLAAGGDDLGGVVPDPVAAYIREHGLYRVDTGSSRA